MNSRDRGCRFPGCCNKKYVDGHHIQHWANGGETSLRNLVSLCRFHHRAVHEGGVTIQVLDDCALRFLTADGRSLDSVARNHSHPFGDWAHLPATHDKAGIRIDCHTAVTCWRGETMDYGLGVQVLLGRARKGRDVSAEM
jgi:hypothetical protein